MNNKHERPHCCYCGRFIKYSDFDDGKAKVGYDISYYGSEKEWQYHVECKDKSFKQANEPRPPKEASKTSE